MKRTYPTIGGDPEFFIYIRDNKKKYQIVSADKVLKGKNEKQDAYYGSIFFDGVQAEINPNYATCRESFISNIQGCIRIVYKRAKDKYPDEDIHLATLASIKIKPKDVLNADNECLRFGCSPDSNIYTEEKIDYPDGKKFMTRFSGGHIHLGFPEVNYIEYMKDPKKMFNLIKIFDYIPGILSVAISRGEDELVRRKWYGQAGTYRIQNHGIEYRTLSSFWLNNPFLTSLFTSLMRDSFTVLYNDLQDKYLFSKIKGEDIRNIINTGDYKQAIEVYKNILVPMYKKFPLGQEIPLTLPFVRKFVELLMENGYSKIFNPYYTANYWSIKPKELKDRFFGTYGINKFSKDLEHNFYKLKELYTLGD